MTTTNEEVYRKVLVPANANHDGEPTLLTLTEEPSGWFIWISSGELGTLPIKYIRYDRRGAIEAAVDLGRRPPETLVRLASEVAEVMRCIS